MSCIDCHDEPRLAIATYLDDRCPECYWKHCAKELTSQLSEARARLADLDECHEADNKLLVTITAERDQLRARLAEVERERDALREGQSKRMPELFDTQDKLRAAEARLASSEAARAEIQQKHGNCTWAWTVVKLEDKLARADALAEAAERVLIRGFSREAEAQLQGALSSYRQVAPAAPETAPSSGYFNNDQARACPACAGDKRAIHIFERCGNRLETVSAPSRAEPERCATCSLETDVASHGPCPAPPAPLGADQREGETPTVIQIAGLELAVMAARTAALEEAAKLADDDAAEAREQGNAESDPKLAALYVTDAEMFEDLAARIRALSVPSQGGE